MTLLRNKCNLREWYGWRGQKNTLTPWRWWRRKSLFDPPIVNADWPGEYQPSLLLDHPTVFFPFYSDGSECRCALEAWRRADKGDGAGHVAAWWMCGRRRRRRSAMVRTENHFTGNCEVIRNQQWLLLALWDFNSNPKDAKQTFYSEFMRNCRSWKQICAAC